MLKFKFNSIFQILIFEFRNIARYNQGLWGTSMLNDDISHNYNHNVALAGCPSPNINRTQNAANAPIAR